MMCVCGVWFVNGCRLRFCVWNRIGLTITVRLFSSINSVCGIWLLFVLKRLIMWVFL